MSGWLEWWEEKIECPKCGEEQTVQICIDTPVRGDPHVGITGGSHTCTSCGKKITFKDLHGRFE